MRVLQLWRFPVKSMQGERLDVADMGELGVEGDRQWALIDVQTGLALTARRVPDLLDAQARWIAPDGVEIELPDDTIAPSDEQLSAWLGRAVTLRRARPGQAGTYEIAADFEHEEESEWVRWQGPTARFHDSPRTAVSIVSGPTMRAWDWRRFRANVVVGADHDGEEDGLVGCRVGIGTAILDVGKQIDRCVMTTRRQPGGIERDLDVLRTINRERASMLGVGELVTRRGTVRVGDDVEVIERPNPATPPS